RTPAPDGRGGKAAGRRRVWSHRARFGAAARISGRGSMSNTKFEISAQLSQAPVLIEYYQGAYGPTVRIDVRRLGSLREIQYNVERLSSGQLQRFPMSELASVAMAPPLKAFTLVAVPSSQR